MLKLLLAGLFPTQCITCKKSGTWICETHQKVKTAPSNQVAYKYLDAIHVATAYQDPTIKKCIEHFKFKGARHLALPLAKCIYQNIPNDLLKSAVIVPIPLHWQRQLWRGYNQSVLLARALRTLESTINLNTRCLSRKKATQQQARLNKTRRIENIQAAFQANGRIPKKIILIDDVVASGSTLDEAARVLKNNGTMEVVAVVLARGG